MSKCTKTYALIRFLYFIKNDSYEENGLSHHDSMYHYCRYDCSALYFWSKHIKANCNGVNHRFSNISLLILPLFIPAIVTTLGKGNWWPIKAPNTTKD